MNDICSQCNISIKFKKNQCSEIWPAKVGNWNENEIQKILNTYSGKESTTKNLIPETHTLTLVASLSTVLVLAIIFILFLILWISFRRKRNSTPDNNFASSNVQNVNENNHPYEEIDENVTTTSFCNYNILDKSTTTINTRNISEETYEDLTERSSPGYDKLVFNELHQVNNENRNNSYHVVEK
ncbi:uncharacterized protein LOC106874494 isoform X2 [Octopus bimaculoides]|uniref:uncharacterized protein LOC106874494 isoform X2 n=1 Tax=Octopus bimaculoides TaxID=37653 RepID=UPI00071C2B7F|nr:uncharacterized protein LOC106874494 isoform X2 [Octopus bimaculoides]|eukprot:XP_014777726.1 PREDICTED: uncharacterized protein LOC106874494 [Octopus bimaculoides]